ncbi:MAG: carbohydrate ABC transporter permease [Trueperaceae bacterium]
MLTSRRISTFGRLVLLLALLVFALLPIVWIVLTSFKNRLDVFAVPPKLIFTPQFGSYVKIFNDPAVVDKLVNSLLIAGLSVTLTLALSSLAAYSFSRFSFAGRSQLLIGILATRLMPPVTAVIPLFILFQGWGLIDTHLGLILIYSALNIPLATWMMKSFFDSVPRELEESARIDGTTWFGALWRVTLPLAAPGIAATSVFIFTLAWNEFMFAFIFTSRNARTLPALLAETLGELQIYWSDMAALSTLIMIPPLLFSFYMQRRLVAGLQTGALK